MFNAFFNMSFRFAWSAPTWLARPSLVTSPTSASATWARYAGRRCSAPACNAALRCQSRHVDRNFALHATARRGATRRCGATRSFSPCAAPSSASARTWPTGCLGCPTRPCSVRPCRPCCLWPATAAAGDKAPLPCCPCSERRRPCLPARLPSLDFCARREIQAGAVGVAQPGPQQLYVHLAAAAIRVSHSAPVSTSLLHTVVDPAGHEAPFFQRHDMLQLAGWAEGGVPGRRGRLWARTAA